MDVNCSFDILVPRGGTRTVRLYLCNVCDERRVVDSGDTKPPTGWAHISCNHMDGRCEAVWVCPEHRDAVWKAMTTA